MTNQDELLLQAQKVIRELRNKLAARSRPPQEPVAIVGMACRFPCGRGDLDAFWKATLSGANAVCDLPRGRWDTSSYPSAGLGKAPFRACFLEQHDAFDAHFFGISSREAMQMDPAQRLFLEVAWHALEDAGQTKQGLAGSDTAVFVGNTGVGEFLAQQLSAFSEIDVYTGTGTGPDVIAGRLSYLLDLQGPCATVNTACSSSLVALHLARRSLLAGECSMAIAGGVNILGPVSTAMASRMDFLAPDGCCKPFDGRADGFGRGEGCGVVVLKRLSDAVAAHDRVLAVIHGSAMNQDGRTNGLTAPNGRSQAALLRRALKDAGIESSQVGYVEAHGTGTPLGDPIEVEAISEVLGSGSSPCGIGSAKGNIGHLEGAAGIAGVIRAVLILQNGVIPPVANFQSLNPHISLSGTRLFVPSTPAPWPREAEARYAGVSSFGWSGSNAHAILGEAPVVSGSDQRFMPLPPYPFRHDEVSDSTPIGTEAPDDWFYETAWPEMAIASRALPHPATRSTKWVIVADRTGFAEQLVEAISGSSDEATLIRAAKVHARDEEYSTEEGVAVVERAVKSIDQNQSVIVVHLLPLDLIDLGLGCEIDPVIDTLMGLVDLVRTLENRAASRNIKLWVVTRGAQRLPHEISTLHLGLSPVWGFFASAALEHPELWGGIVDLDPHPSLDEATLIMQHLAARDGEDRALFREGRRHVARLRQAAPPSHTVVKIDPDAMYLITGAFGGIGLGLAEWLVGSGAKHLVLLGRASTAQVAAAEAASQSSIDRWQASGVIIQRATCDVADLEQMSMLFSQSNSSGHPIRGILHAAADVIWKPLVDLNHADLRASFRAKAEGSLVLHELSRTLSLDFLVFFSSAAVAVGAREGSAYAAANAFMDALALERCDMGLPTLSVQWGNWHRRVAHTHVDQQQFGRSGFRPMPPERATNALGRLLEQNNSSARGSQRLVAHIDRSLLQAATAMRGQSLFLSELDSDRSELPDLQEPSLVATLRALPRARRIETLAEFVTARVRHTLGWTAKHPVDPMRGFFDMGFDSLKSIELKNGLSKATGLSLSSTLVMTYPNVNAVTEFLHVLLFGEAPQNKVSHATGETAPASESLTDAQAHEALAAELESLRGRFDV